MILKKISCLCVVLLLLVGMSSVANAADPQGVRLRITHPADDSWAGIGDSVVVKVEFLPGSAALDSVIVGIVEDTSTTVMSSLTNSSGIFSKAFTAADAAAADSDGFKSFTHTFPVTAGMTVESSAKTLSLSARVSKTGAAAFTQLTNQSTDDAITGASFGVVGDGVSIGIDAQRPSASIDSVRLDTTGITNFPTDGGTNPSGKPKKAFKIGSKVKVSFFVQNVPANAKGMIYIVDTSNVTSAADSAMKTVNFTFGQLVTGSTVDSSTTLAAGDVAGNNRRVVAVSFLQDAAGNLSSSGVSDVTPVGITDINMHVLDLTLPVITPANPKAGATDSTYFTGVVDTALSIVPTAGGAAASVTFAANPLEFKTSEGVKTATAEFNNVIDTLTAAATNAATGLVAGNSFKVKFATDFGITTQAGKSENLTISVTDSVGNAGTNTQSGVTYDQKVPGIVAGSLFPTRAAAPPDVSDSNAPTINRTTMMPVLRQLEATDSLSVRYISTAAGTIYKAIETIAAGDAQLAKTDVDISVNIADTLVTEKDYSLQVFFRDLAGNHNITAPDTLTFDKAFVNPTADSFAVTASGGVDAVIAGQALILDIVGIDTALTRAAGSNRAAVTYNAAASIRVSAGDQDTSSVTISGTGVTDNGDGTASLDSASWSLGTRSVTIKSTNALTYFTAVVENKTGADVNFGGEIDSLVVDAAELSKYAVAVVADSDGGDTATSVSGGFKVSVAGTDLYGNASTKTYSSGTTTPSRADSTALTNAAMDSSLWLGEIFVQFASNNGDVAVPQGPQAVSQAGSVFTVGGASTSGTDLVIQFGQSPLTVIRLVTPQPQGSIIFAHGVAPQLSRLHQRVWFQLIQAHLVHRQICSFRIGWVPMAWVIRVDSLALHSLLFREQIVIASSVKCRLRAVLTLPARLIL